MKYVLDANVALKWVLPEPDSQKAVQLLDDFANKTHELIAPSTFPIEVAHSLARAERKGIISVGDGWQSLTDILDNCPFLHDYLSLLPDAYSIASLARIGVYDCLYVALAEQQNCQMITADSKLINALKSTHPFLMDLSSI